MKSVLLSLVFGAVSLGFVAVTPGEAAANWGWRRGYYGGRGYGYYPRYGYGGYYSGYAPYYSSSYRYYAPGYSAFYGPGYRTYTPGWSYFGGPRAYYTAPRMVYSPRHW